jgi:CBS-domain-containing membrane protein
VVATLVGLDVLQVTGPQAWAAAAAVGLAVVAMYVTATFHPPAGINPLLVVSNNLPLSFLLVPVLAGAVLLAAFAYVWHRGSVVSRGRSAGGSAVGERRGPVAITA